MSRLRNRLLDTLPGATLTALRAELEPVTLDTRTVLFEPTAAVAHVYFPETAVVSLVSEIGDGDSATQARSSGRSLDRSSERSGERQVDERAVEVGTVGCEGMVGLSVFLSGGPDGRSPVSEGVRALVQIPGVAHRMPASTFAAFARTPGPLQRLLLRYTQAYLAQVARTAACNLGHGVDARCARWLLMTRDRVSGDAFPLTATFLALMIGVRRAGVAVALRTLEEGGLVELYTGGVRIRDRDRLETVACACYAAVRAQYAELLAHDDGRAV